MKNLIVIDQLDEEEIIPSNVCRFSQLMSTTKQQQSINEKSVNKDETEFDDVINVQFTSGTTGLPKGSMLTHFNIVQNGQFIAPILFEKFSEQPKICIPNPLYHAFGCVVGTVASIFVQGTIILPGPIFNVDSTLKSIEKFGCNYLYGTPTMWSDLLQHSKFNTDNLKTLKRGIMSGAPCPPNLLRKIHETLPSLEHILVSFFLDLNDEIHQIFSPIKDSIWFD